MPSLEITFAAQTPTMLLLIRTHAAKQAALAMFRGRTGEAQVWLDIADQAGTALEDGLDDVSNPHGSPSEA